MKILITGAAGFIGSHTAERFKSLGYTVIGIDNFSSHYDIGFKRLNERTLNLKGISIINKDLNDSNLADALPDDINYIFHFAAQPGISSTNRFKDYFVNNILATKNLLDYALGLKDLKLFRTCNCLCAIPLMWKQT